MQQEFTQAVTNNWNPVLEILSAQYAQCLPSDQIKVVKEKVYTYNSVLNNRQRQRKQNSTIALYILTGS
jgi:hypothetical protein